MNSESLSIIVWVNNIIETEWHYVIDLIYFDLIKPKNRFLAVQLLVRSYSHHSDTFRCTTLYVNFKSWFSTYNQPDQWRADNLGYFMLVI